MAHSPHQRIPALTAGPAAAPTPGVRARPRRGTAALHTIIRDPATLIVGDGAVWTTATAAQDPVVMGPIAAWLWAGTFFLARRATVARERPRRPRR